MAISTIQQRRRVFAPLGARWDVAYSSDQPAPFRLDERTWTVGVRTPEEELRQYAHQMERARQLLQPSETEIPKPVQETIRYLNSWELWFRLSRNLPAKSCKDAIAKREMLGSRGILPWMELKTGLYEWVHPSCEREVFACHYRGDEVLSEPCLRYVTNREYDPRIELRRLPEDQVAALGLGYGLINPCLIPETMQQYFDEGLMHPIGAPGSVTTNAGVDTWAVEFYVNELAMKLARCYKYHADFRNLSRPERARLEAMKSGTLGRVDIAPFAVRDPEITFPLPGLRNPKPIGIITGNSVHTGTAFLNMLDAHLTRLLGRHSHGDITKPPIVFHSMPEMGLSMELDLREEHVWDAMQRAVKSMIADGAKILTIADNTTQYFAPRIREMCEPHGVEFVSIAEALAAHLRREKIDRITLLGIRFVPDFEGGYSAYAEPLKGIQVDKPDERTLQKMLELGYQVKREGATGSGINKLRDLLKQDGDPSPVTVIALTELSELLALQGNPGKSSKKIVDTLDVYAEAVARKFLGIEHD